MWLFTTFGFFSVVQKKAGDTLTVRARDRADLDRLRQRYLPELGPTAEWTGTDYAYRATAPRTAVAFAMARIVQELEYDNFKDAVAGELGHGRESLCHEVWGTMRKLQKPKQAPGPAPSSRARPSLRKAYGGVVFDAAGRVYVREPTGHFDGYLWSFAKGRPEPGESPEQAALREVRQELGVEAAIDARIPGEFRGGTTENVYFLMSLVRDARDWELEESTAVRVVPPDEARQLLATSTNVVGRKRDLAVLDAALELRAELAAEGRLGSGGDDA